jgi:hypothetical protein
VKPTSVPDQGQRTESRVVCISVKVNARFG